MCLICLFTAYKFQGKCIKSNVTRDRSRIVLISAYSCRLFWLLADLNILLPDPKLKHKCRRRLHGSQPTSLTAFPRSRRVRNKNGRSLSPLYPAWPANSIEAKPNSKAEAFVGAPTHAKEKRRPHWNMYAPFPIPFLFIYSWLIAKQKKKEIRKYHPPSSKDMNPTRENQASLISGGF